MNVTPRPAPQHRSRSVKMSYRKIAKTVYVLPYKHFFYCFFYLGGPAYHPCLFVSFTQAKLCTFKVVHHAHFLAPCLGAGMSLEILGLPSSTRSSCVPSVRDLWGCGTDFWPGIKNVLLAFVPDLLELPWGIPYLLYTKFIKIKEHTYI